MTTEEMYIEFVRLLQFIDKSVLEKDLPTSNSVLQMLNIAQLRYLKEVYFNNEDYDTILEKSESIKNLIVRSLFTPSANIGALSNNSKVVTLSNIEPSFLFYIRSDSKITRSDLPSIDTAKWIPNDYIKIRDKEKYLTNPFNNPIIVKPGCYIEKSGEDLHLVILYDQYTTLSETNSVSIEYIKEPDEITFDVNCELPSHLHEEIVKLAVDLYINYYKFRLSTNTQSKTQ